MQKPHFELKLDVAWFWTPGDAPFNRTSALLVMLDKAGRI